MKFPTYLTGGHEGTISKLWKVVISVLGEKCMSENKTDS